MDLNDADLRQKRLEDARRYNLKARRKKRRAVYEYLLTHPCVDCGEADIRVLEFDHVRGTKTMAIREMLSRTAPLARIFEEIAKCDVRCANCHRRATIARGGLLEWLDILSEK